MDNWLEIVVGIYLLGMILYGHYKGFLRLAVSMAALVSHCAYCYAKNGYICKGKYANLYMDFRKYTRDYGRGIENG